MSKSFSDFINQSILTNINDDEIVQGWQSDQVRHYRTLYLLLVYFSFPCENKTLYSELFLPLYFS
jgi:hypothetical protein